MARRRRGEPESSEGVSVDAPAAEGQPQIEVRMRGGADDVKRQLGVATEEKPAATAPGPDDDKKKFVDSLRNSRYIIRVKRTTPREFGGVKTNVEVWSTELPMGYQEIQDEVSKECGGGKYRVAIIDPASNNTIAADTFEVDGNPTIPETEMSQEEQDRIFLAGRPKTSSEITAESLERQHLVLTKQAEVERAEAELLDARERRKQSKAPVQDDTRIAELDRRLTEARHQADLEARDRKHAEEMRELKAMIANAQPKKAEGDGMMMMLLEQMREDRKLAQAQFSALLTQMKDEKLNAVLDEVKSIRNKPQQQSGSLLEQAEAMLKMKKIFGWGGEDEDDDGDDADDTRPWWERALDKLGGKFGDKLLAKFTDMEEKGQTVDRETFMKGMSEYADQVAADAVSRQRGALPAPGKSPALPAPPAAPPAQQLPPPPPTGTVTQLPPPPPAAAPPAPTKTMTVTEEIALRASGVLEMLAREIEIRPIDYLWNYEGAWQSLPESILEKVCAAPDAPGVVDALVIDGVIDQAKVAELKAKIAGSPRILAWVTKGLNDLKSWWASRQTDPDFDPFADEDDGEGAVE